MPLPPSRYPRALVSFDGQTARWDDLVEIVWEPNVYYEADTLTVTLQNVGPSGELLSDYLRKEMTVDLWLGYVPNPTVWSVSDLAHVFFGQIDGVLPKFGQERLVEVRCRDLSRLLIDTEVTQTLVNMLASDVAVLFAQQVNLAVEVVPTPLVADLTTFEKKSQWEILQVLAEREGYIVFVDTEGVLHFQPRAAASPSIGQWVYNGPPYDILAADFDDSSLLVNTVTVLVWLGVDQGLASGQAIDDARVAAMGGRTVERIVYSRTAKDANECAIEAQGILTSLARAPITGTATLEGNPAIVGDVVVTLTGQLGRFANDYYVERATHHLSAQNAYTVDVTVTNVRPEASEVYRDALYQGPTDAATQAASQGATAATSGLSGGGNTQAAVQQMLDYAQTFLGAPYHWGGKIAATPPSSSQLDCSGFVGLCARSVGLGSFPLGSAETQKETCTAVTAGQQQPGDLVFFSDNPDTQVFHVGMVWSDTSQMINETPPGVKIQAIPSTWGAVSYGRIPGLGVSAQTSSPTGATSTAVSPTVTTKTVQAGVMTTTTVPKPPPSGSVFDAAPAFVQQAIMNGGWPQELWNAAAAVSQIESEGWQADKVADTIQYTGGICNQPYTFPSGLQALSEYSVGLFQINTCAHKEFGTAEQLKDPTTNARAGYQLYLQQGWGAWSITAHKLRLL